MRVTGGALAAQRILFLGAGEAGIGIADLIVAAMVEEGLDEAAARRQCWFVDSRGLVDAGRGDLATHKRPYAHHHDHGALPDLLAAVEALRPHALIGVSGQARTFSREVVAAMARHHQRPIVFALSNPTANAECTAEEAYRGSDGRALFASGSPFAPVTLAGRTHVPGQGNNVYIFPGVGLGVVAAKARHVTDEMFMAAAKTLAARVTEEDLGVGRLYPHLTTIRASSLAIAVAVAEVAYAQGLADEPRPDDLRAYVASLVYEPEYKDDAG